MARYVDPEIDEFYAEHCALPGGVVLVITEDDEHAIFSTLDKAHDWAMKAGKGGGCIYSPYIVDMPEYGNVPVEEQN